MTIRSIEIAKDLEVEYNRLLPVVASGLTSVISSAD